MFLRSMDPKLIFHRGNLLFDRRVPSYSHCFTVKHSCEKELKYHIVGWVLCMHFHKFSSLL